MWPFCSQFTTLNFLKLYCLKSQYAAVNLNETAQASLKFLDYVFVTSANWSMYKLILILLQSKSVFFLSKQFCFWDRLHVLHVKHLQNLTFSEECSRELRVSLTFLAVLNLTSKKHYIQIIFARERNLLISVFNLLGEFRESVELNAHFVFKIDKEFNFSILITLMIKTFQRKGKLKGSKLKLHLYLNKNKDGVQN